MGDQNQTTVAPATAPVATTGVSQTKPGAAPIKKDATGASILTDLYKQLEKAKQLAAHFEAQKPDIGPLVLMNAPTVTYSPQDMAAFADLLKKDVAAKVDALKARIREHGFEAD